MSKNQQVNQLDNVVSKIDDATARIEALFCVCIDSGEEVTKGHIATFLRMINENLTEQLGALYQLAHEEKLKIKSEGVCYVDSAE